MILPSVLSGRGCRACALALASLAVTAVIFSADARGATADSLETGFDSPSGTAKPLVWWHWINGNVTKEGIAADLEDMKRVGIGGAQILDVEIYLPKGPVRYGTDSWHEHVQFAIKKAAELGLEIDMANSSGWSGAGGPWVTPELSMKQVVWSETETSGGSVSVSLPQPTAKLNFYRDVAVIAVPSTTERLDNIDTKINWKAKPVPKFLATGAEPAAIPLDKVVNLTGKMDAAGKLKAQLPQGKWVILRFGYTVTGSDNHPATPEGHGLEVNKLDADAVAFQFDKSLGRIIKEAGPLAGKTFAGILFDSFEAGFQNWTAALPAEFQKQKKYDFVPWMPVLTGRILQSREASEGVLWDFRNVIDELFAENYFGTMHKLAAAHGMKIYSESQGGPLNPMSANRHVDVPMNEFWMPDIASRVSRMKMSSSAAGFYGRNIVGAEAFTAKPEDGKHLAIPSTLKSPGDYAFVTGINRFIFHHYTHQPVTAAAPGFALGRYGSHFGRLNTWWPYADAWISYLSRSQFLLQQGRTVADVAVLVDENTGYGLTAKNANLVPGYDFNVCYPAYLRDMSMKDGRLVHPQGHSFGLLVTPDAWVAELSTLRHLRDLIQAGARIVGNPPNAPAGLRDVENQAEFKSLVQEIWDGLDGKRETSKKLGAGFVYRGVKPPEVLEQEGIVPDLSWAPATVPFKFIHRSTADADIYFVFNYSKDPVSAHLEFRQKDRVPELWNSETGSHVDSPIYSATKNGTALPVQFEPYGSVFVVFRKPVSGKWIAAADPVELEEKNAKILTSAASVSITYSDGAQKTLSMPVLPAASTFAGPWQIAFLDGRGAPPKAVYQKLQSWSEDTNPGIKYYSGAATYTTTFQAPAAKPLQAAILDLGNVADIASVAVNGQPAGILWMPPFRVDVTPLLKPGVNTLQVSVANRWVNRLIGDEAIPVDFAYQKKGTNKFTDGRLLSLPDWLYDPRKLSSKKRQSFSTWQHYAADSPLLPSGLLGPVKLEWLNVVQPPQS